jgi:plasmid rolling circle replication initiator protein Rep
MEAINPKLAKMEMKPNLIIANPKANGYKGQMHCKRIICMEPYTCNKDDVKNGALHI